MKQISFIIPTLNEESNLAKQELFLKSILQSGHEVIIVDGGSLDDTKNIAKKIGCKCISTKASRGHQLHAGTEISTNDILVFQHADTMLKFSCLEHITAALAQTNSQWGCFKISFTNPGIMYNIIAWFMNKRSCLTGIVTGDHTFFMKREIYFKSDGFSDIPIMEDIELSQKLKKFSRPLCLKDTAITSSRKWEENGVIKTILMMWYLRILYFFGTPAEVLAKKYYAK